MGEIRKLKARKERTALQLVAEVLLYQYVSSVVASSVCLRYDGWVLSFEPT